MCASSGAPPDATFSTRRAPRVLSEASSLATRSRRLRTLRAPGVVAQVPWLLVPMKPGVAGLPGVVEAHLRREDRPLQILPGEDAVRIGERTWLRRRSSQDGEEEAVYEAADGGGTLVIEFWCRDAVCRGAAGEAMVAQIARTARSLQ